MSDFKMVMLEILASSKQFEQLQEMVQSETTEPQVRERAVVLLLKDGENTKEEVEKLLQLSTTLLRDEASAFSLKTNWNLRNDVSINVEFSEECNRPRSKRATWLLELIDSGQLDSYAGKYVAVYNFQDTYRYFVSRTGRDAYDIVFKVIGPEFFGQALPKSVNEHAGLIRINL